MREETHHGLEGAQDREQHDELHNPQLVGRPGQAHSQQADQQRRPARATDSHRQAAGPDTIENQDRQQAEVIGQEGIPQRTQPGEGEEDAGERHRIGEPESVWLGIEDRCVPVAGPQVSGALGIPVQRPQIEQRHRRR